VRPLYRTHPSPTALAQAGVGQLTLNAAWGLALLEQVPLQKHSDRCGRRESHLGSNQRRHWPDLQVRVPQHSAVLVQLAPLVVVQENPFSQCAVQHSVLAVQEFPSERHKRRKPKRLSQIPLQH
jgi:hypothetical protein